MDVVTAQLVAVMVSVTCKVPVPAVPQVTVMLLPDPLIVPPVMLQLYVWPATLGVL